MRDQVDFCLELTQCKDHYNIFLHLLELFLAKSKPEQFDVAIAKLNYAFSPDLLASFASKNMNILQKLGDAGAQAAMHAQKPMLMILNLLNAINAMEDCEQMSSLHTNFALLCLKAKCLQHALPVIERPFTRVTPQTSALDLLTYNYYRGTIFLCLERYECAMAAYLKVLSQPCEVLH